MHPQVYPPAEDTWLLVRAAEAECRDGERVLEIGCGSAEISGTLHQRARVVATDINPHAVEMARDAGIPTVRADLCEAFRGPFDLVLFNAPYLPTAPGDRIDDWLEYALDGGPDGRRVVARFLAGVGRVLAPGGRVLLLISSLTGFSEVCLLIRQNGFIPDHLTKEQVEGETLFVIRFRKEENEALR